MNDRIFALEHGAPSASCSSPKTQSTPGSLPASAAWPALAKDAAKDASRPPRAPPTSLPGPAAPPAAWPAEVARPATAAAPPPPDAAAQRRPAGNRTKLWIRGFVGDTTSSYLARHWSTLIQSAIDCKLDDAAALGHGKMVARNGSKCYSITWQSAEDADRAFGVLTAMSEAGKLVFQLGQLRGPLRAHRERNPETAPRRKAFGQIYDALRTLLAEERALGQKCRLGCHAHIHAVLPCGDRVVKIGWFSESGVDIDVDFKKSMPREVTTRVTELFATSATHLKEHEAKGRGKGSGR